ncbi:DUF4199 domain-containing protein [Aquimarina aggregata]|uniref:DUF4199 domain-containing protein n=1 Tax=Aquimarina aggregata TaxID=1642818 RepID=UPI0024906D37|nr:DUF4199 domain-containing protein [Aquimarina aggregata]
MAETNISTKKVIVKYGLTMGVLWVIYGITRHFSHYDETIGNWLFSTIEISIYISLIIYAIYSYKVLNGGFLGLSKAIKIGIGIALIGGIMTFVWNITLYKIIEPNMLNQILEIKREEMIASNPDKSQEQIVKSMEIAKKYSSPYLISLIMLASNLFLGFLISLLGGAIMQKQRNPF